MLPIHNPNNDCGRDAYLAMKQISAWHGANVQSKAQQRKSKNVYLLSGTVKVTHSDVQVILDAPFAHLLKRKWFRLNAHWKLAPGQTPPREEYMPPAPPPGHMTQGTRTMLESLQASGRLRIVHLNLNSQPEER